VHNSRDLSTFNDHVLAAVSQVVVDCAISSDLEYTRANPTFHHWRTESRRYGLAFQNSTDALHFERGVRIAIDNLLQQGNLQRFTFRLKFEFRLTVEQTLGYLL